MIASVVGEPWRHRVRPCAHVVPQIPVCPPFVVRTAELSSTIDIRMVDLGLESEHWRLLGYELNRDPEDTPFVRSAGRPLRYSPPTDRVDLQPARR